MALPCTRRTAACMQPITSTRRQDNEEETTPRTHGLAKLLDDHRLAEVPGILHVGVQPCAAKGLVGPIPVVGPHVDGGKVNAVHQMVGQKVLPRLQRPRAAAAGVGWVGPASRGVPISVHARLIRLCIHSLLWLIYQIWLVGCPFAQLGRKSSHSLNLNKERVNYGTGLSPFARQRTLP